MPGLVDDVALHRNLALESLGPVAPSGLRGQLDGMAPIVEKFDTARLAIATDPGLTAFGRHTKTQELIETATADAQAWGTAITCGLESQRAAIEAARETAYAQTRTRPPAEAITFKAEQLMALSDPLEGDAAYLAGTDDERELMEAAAALVGRRPRKMPDGTIQLVNLISPTLLTETRAARLARFDPASTAQLETLARLRNTITAHVGYTTALLQGV